MFLNRSSRWRSAALAAAVAALAPATWAQATDGFLSPARGESLAPGSIVEVSWASLCGAGRGREIDEAEIVLSLDGGKTFPIRVTPELKPCAARYLWKVPALPAAHARLALRAGADEREATESIEILSADFRILPDPDGRVEQLRRRAAEWWIPAAPAVLSAEDLLERTMSAARDEISLPTLLPDAAMPTSSPSALRPSRVAVSTAPARLQAVALLTHVPARGAGAPTPLRL
ncbi:MAG TPA: hypothetical protein VGG65_02440 [Thermoanaerobaculia bacterium]